MTYTAPLQRGRAACAIGGCGAHQKKHISRAQMAAHAPGAAAWSPMRRQLIEVTGKTCLAAAAPAYHVSQSSSMAAARGTRRRRRPASRAAVVCAHERGTADSPHTHQALCARPSHMLEVLGVAGRPRVLLLDGAAAGGQRGLPQPQRAARELRTTDRRRTAPTAVSHMVPTRCSMHGAARRAARAVPAARTGGGGTRKNHQLRRHATQRRRHICSRTHHQQMATSS